MMLMIIYLFSLSSTALQEVSKITFRICFFILGMFLAAFMPSLGKEEVTVVWNNLDFQENPQELW